MDRYQIIISQLNKAAADYRGLAYRMLVGDTDSTLQSNIVSYFSSSRYQGYENNPQNPCFFMSTMIESGSNDPLHVYRTHVLFRSKCYNWNLVAAYKILNMLCYKIMGTFGFPLLNRIHGVLFKICHPQDVLFLMHDAAKQIAYADHGDEFICPLDENRLDFARDNVFLDTALFCSNLYQEFCTTTRKSHVGKNGDRVSLQPNQSETDESRPPLTIGQETERARIKLSDFLRDFCEVTAIEFESKKRYINRLNKCGEITLPEPINAAKRKSGQAFLYYTDDLLTRWPRCCNENYNLPKMKSETKQD